MGNPLDELHGLLDAEEVTLDGEAGMVVSALPVLGEQLGASCPSLP